MKERDLSDEKYRHRKAAAEGGRVYASPTCTKSLTISLFFDGTNNHEPSDREAKPRSTSNIARLYPLASSHGNTGKDTDNTPKPDPCLSLCFFKPQVCAAPLTASKEWIMSEFAAVWQSIQHGLAGLALAALLPAQAMGNKPPTEMVPAGVEGYNHTSAAINRFSVNRAGGHNIGPFNNGGGSQSCCASLPRQWRPGLMATVEWEKDAKPYGYSEWGPINSEQFMQAFERHKAQNYSTHRAVVEIPRYDEPCAIQVHFLPCDQVRATATCHKPSSPNFPHKDWYQIKEPKTCPK